MDRAALVFACLAAVVHVYIWVMESLTWRKPATWKRFGVASQDEAETQRLFAYNQGFYNLFLAIGAFVGAFYEIWPLLFFACACMFGASLVLLSCGVRYARAAAMQGVLPLLAILTGIAALN